MFKQLQYHKANVQYVERWRINGFNLIFTIFTCYSIKKKNLNMGPTDYILKKMDY